MPGTPTSRLSLPTINGASDTPSSYPAVNLAQMDALDVTVRYFSGTLANRGTVIASPIAGDQYYATDTTTLYRWNGSVWVIAPRVSSSSTSFPTANLGDECFRTDLDTWYKYDGSAWWPMLIPGAWSTVPSSGGYFYGWSGTVRARREGDVVRLSGQLTNSGASGSDGSTCFVLPFPAPTQTTKWFTQVSANANPVLFSIASGEYGTTVEIDPYSEDTFAPSGFVSFEGCTYTIS